MVEEERAQDHPRYAPHNIHSKMGYETCLRTICNGTTISLTIAA